MNDKNKPICVMQAPLFTRSGYGGWAMAVAKSLLKYKKFDTYFAPTRWGNCPKKNSESDVLPHEKEVFDKILKSPLQKQPELFLQMTIPVEFNPVGKYNIGLTAGIETSCPPGQWIEGLNKMNMNIVLSNFNKEVFSQASFIKQSQDGRKENLKSEKPMEVVFWGIDTDVFKKTETPVQSVEDIMNKIPEDFAFLFVGQWTSQGLLGDRKDIASLIKTFLETFKGMSKKPCLILKTSGATLSTMDKYDCINKIKEVESWVGGDIPNVYLIHGELSDIEMNALYNHKKVKVHVSMAHGEGFGMPLLESTLSGKPLIVSEWSGHMDFLNPKYANFFKGELVNIPQEALNDYFIKEAKWFQVDYQRASEKLLSFYKYYGKSMLEDAESLRKENEEKFSTQAMDKVLHSVLDKYVPEFVVQSNIVLPKLKKLNLPKLNKTETKE
jgi:hypothetical protein